MKGAFYKERLFIFLERREGKEKEGETPWVAFHTPPVCPDWESNQRPFGLKAGTESTEPHQPGCHAFLKNVFLTIVKLPGDVSFGCTLGSTFICLTKDHRERSRNHLSLQIVITVLLTLFLVLHFYISVTYSITRTLQFLIFFFFSTQPLTPVPSGDVRQKHQPVASCMHRNLGPNPQPRHVP